MNAKEIALCVFETKKYSYSADELDLFIQRIDKINELGLISLNKGIETATHRNIDDKLVEHNFAHELLKYQTNIEYEPPYLTLPPDFKIINNNIEFWFQLKIYHYWKKIKERILSLEKLNKNFLVSKFKNLFQLTYLMIFIILILLYLLNLLVFMP